ncbi:MAG TPA: saccharopine dehydrogenase NADP-binding domain-containing protein [Rhizomicrobium sp.]|nr:saccharopine dehydrogenase NADP-binding domain-containing protein [Rhizomicrobium sp.]
MTGARSASQHNKNIAVYGAYGHTGRFVVQELRRRGWNPIASGRDAEKLRALAAMGMETRQASIDDPAALDRALAGAAAVVNCAGPFLDTGTALVEAALRAGIVYLDLAAEQMAALALFERYQERARQARITVIPAMAFYGGLGDLLATAAMGDWTHADEILVAVALDSWHPTDGTRRTGERNTATRVVVSQGKFVPLADPSPRRSWDFPPPFGTQDVVGVPLTEIVTISRHLRAGEVHSFMNLTPLHDLGKADTPPPQLSHDGRSAQLFLVDVTVRNGGSTRRAIARGRDIYAVSAPLVVEAMERILAEPGRDGGVFAPGAIFDATSFLASLSPAHLTFELV